jgi:hypothetical protein
MLAVNWGMGIVAVRIAVLNASVAAVFDDFDAVPAGRAPGCVHRVRLSIVMR